MSKSKAVTISIIVSVSVVSLGLFIYGNMNIPSLPPLGVVEVPDKGMPILENKDSIEGNKDDLISFSILPYTKVRGILSYRGVIKGGYFFEANILINILDANKNVLKSSNAVATSPWTTAEGVNFEGNIDFTEIQKGFAYFEIHNDNASGLPENDKFIRIPIVIE